MGKTHRIRFVVSYPPLKEQHGTRQEERRDDPEGHCIELSPRQRATIAVALIGPASLNCLPEMGFGIAMRVKL